MTRPIENSPQPETEVRDRAYTDRQLLELAAKAAGYVVARESDDGTGLLLVGVQEPWNPLTSSSDALCLVVVLNLTIICSDHETRVEGPRGGGEYAYESLATDPLGATHRAIVRAAAAIAEGAKS